MAISKTDFVRALQCEKMMWLDKHKPDKKIIPEEVQRRLDEGNEYGDNAMGIFGEYTETTAYKEDGRLDYGRMIKTTEELILNCTPVICEAAFSFYGNYCAVDILRLTQNGYFTYEVKNSPEIKEVFLEDVAFQSYILKKCGLKIKKSHLILNGGDDGYKIIDVTRDIYPYERMAYTKVREFSKLKNSKNEPDVPTGPQCEAPYRCWYYDYCHKKE